MFYPLYTKPIALDHELNVFSICLQILYSNQIRVAFYTCQEICEVNAYLFLQLKIEFFEIESHVAKTEGETSSNPQLF